MAKKPPVHVVAREDGWAVIREGNDRATSVHQTQAEAGREGRDIARRNETGFMLHGKDGRIREHNDYGSGQRPQEGLPTGQAMKNCAPGTHALGESTTDEKGQTVQRTMDEQGDVVESTFDTEGNVVGESPAGSVADLPEAEGYEEITDEEGITKRIVKDESGTLIEVQIGPDGSVLDLLIPPSTEKIEETTQQVGQAAQGAQDGAGRAADQAQATTGQAAGQAQDDAGGATRQERDIAGQATDQADQAAQGAAGQQAQDAAGQVTDQDQGSAGQAAGQGAPEGQATAARATRQGNGDSQQNGEQAEGQELNATPAAKRKAEEMDVDLYQTEGTGSDGRITAKDVTTMAGGAQERAASGTPQQGEERQAEEKDQEAEGDVKDAVSQTAGQAAQGVQDTTEQVSTQAQDLVGGLAGENQQGEGEDRGDSKETAHQAAEQPRQAARGMQDTASRPAGRVRDTVGGAPDGATQQARDVIGQDTRRGGGQRQAGGGQELDDTDAAKRKDEEKGVDLAQVEGSGTQEEITDDVTDHSEPAEGGTAKEQRAAGRAEKATQGERDAAGRTEEASQANRRAEDKVVGSTFGDAERSAGKTRRTATDGKTSGVRHGGISDDRVDSEEEVRGMTDKGRDDESSEAIAKGYAGYEVRDRHGERLGEVDQLFLLDETDRLEYIGIDLPGGRAVLIPVDVIRDEGQRRMTVLRPKSLVGRGPTIGDDEEVTPGLEERVRSHYGLPIRPGIEDGSGHGALLTEGRAETTENEVSAAVNSGISVGDTESGEFREHDPGDEGVGQSGASDLEDQDELRVQRSEEELRAGTREREAGSVNVRKTVHTDRESIEVPIRREEVTVERVPASGESTGIQIGEDEVSVPVVEEEVVVEKRPVVKEEVRVRKGVVEDTETVEEDVRREEVEVDDRIERRTR